MTERELVIEYKKAKDTLDRLKEEKSKAEINFMRIQSQLVEDLEARDATSTAKYDGVGRISLDKPRLFANVTKENQEQLFTYLDSIGREDLVKPSVHPSTLSSFAKEQTELGKSLPDFINVSFKRVTRITA